MQTALSTFGPISDTRIISQGGGLLKAEVIFDKRSSAEEAVRQLQCVHICLTISGLCLTRMENSGALADGQQLVVEIVADPTPTAPRRDRQLNASGMVHNHLRGSESHSSQSRNPPQPDLFSMPES